LTLGYFDPIFLILDNPTTKPKEFKMGNLIEDYLSVKSQIDELSKKKKAIEVLIFDTHKQSINTQLADKDYGCGTVNVDVGNHKIKFVVSKKVEYDQKQLANIYDRIVASNENPSDYMVIKYDVSESKYKAWPAKIQEVFNAARTVKASAPTFSVEIK